MGKENTEKALNEAYLVQKTTPIISMRSGLALAELKLLDVYLSKINSHEITSRTVRFDKQELEKIFGVARIRTEVLDAALHHLVSQTVRLQDKDDPEHFVYISLFDRAECRRDDTGKYSVTMRCGESAMKYIFYPENLGYLQYRLSNIIKLKHRASYMLYLYLETNAFRGTWTVPIEELQSILLPAKVDAGRGSKAKNKTQEPEFTGEFKIFNRNVLKPAMEELAKSTGAEYSCELVREGHKVKAIKFSAPSKFYDMILDSESVTLGDDIL